LPQVNLRQKAHIDIRCIDVITLKFLFVSFRWVKNDPAVVISHYVSIAIATLQKNIKDSLKNVLLLKIIRKKILIKFLHVDIVNRHSGNYNVFSSSREL